MSKEDQALYLEMAYHQSRVITETYSTSFSSAIRRLDPRHRNHIYAVYGMVRLGDEIVDAGFEINIPHTLTTFQSDIATALEQGFSTNPVIHAFQDTVHRFHIDRALIDSFFKSMEADITQNAHTTESFQDYVYGSAEVVGLMCLAIFCEGDTAKYHSLIEPARALGSAFQKVNFLRDLKADAIDRGRSYFPGVDLHNFTERDKKQIEDDIEREYTTAAKALPHLPPDARKAVSLALSYFRQLLCEIQKTPASVLLTKRIRVSTLKKMGIVMKNTITH